MFYSTVCMSDEYIFFHCQYVQLMLNAKIENVHVFKLLKQIFHFKAINPTIPFTFVELLLQHVLIYLKISSKSTILKWIFV